MAFIVGYYQIRLSSSVMLHVCLHSYTLALKLNVAAVIYEPDRGYGLMSVHAYMYNVRAAYCIGACYMGTCTYMPIIVCLGLGKHYHRDVTVHHCGRVLLNSVSDREREREREREKRRRRRKGE